MTGAHCTVCPRYCTFGYAPDRSQKDRDYWLGKRSSQAAPIVRKQYAWTYKHTGSQNYVRNRDGGCVRSSSSARMTDSARRTLLLTVVTGNPARAASCE